MPSFYTIEIIKENLEKLENEYDFSCEYIYIIRSLMKNHFITSKNTNTRIECAICLCKLISRPDLKCMFEEHEEERVMLFLIEQLQKLDPLSDHYDQYCEILKIINITKVFASCSLENQQDKNNIFDKLFSVAFDLVENNAEEGVKSELLSILKAVLETETLHFRLLHTIFENIINPMKTRRKITYEFTIKLISNLKSDFEGFFKNFTNFIMENDRELSSCKIFSVAYELRNIFPETVQNLIFNYATKGIISPAKDVQLMSFAFIGKMFSLPESVLVSKEQELKIFLEGLKYIDEQIRSITSKYVVKIFSIHSQVRAKITKLLKTLVSSGHPEIRITAIYCIMKIIFKNIHILQDNEFFAQFFLRTKLDPEFSVRETELSAVSVIYKDLIGNFLDFSPEVRTIFLSIPSKLLHKFEKNESEDKILIGNLYKEFFVPFDFPVERRMKCLFHFYLSLHSNQLDSFENLEFESYKKRQFLQLWVKFVKFADKRLEIIEELKNVLTKIGIADSIAFIRDFEKHLKKEKILFDKMEIISDPNTSCEEAIETLNLVEEIVKKLDSEFRAKFLQIIENGTSFILDRESIEVLINCVFEALENGPIVEELDLNPESAGERGMKLLLILTQYYPDYFESTQILEKFIDYLNTSDVKTKILMLLLLEGFGKKKNLAKIVSKSTLELLIRTCKNLAIEGTAKESRASIKCLKSTIQDFDQIYDEILDNMEEHCTLISSSEFFLGSIVALGNIAAERSSKKCTSVETLISKVLDFIKAHDSSGNDETEEKEWCQEDELAVNEICFEESINCLSLWICSLSNLTSFANDFFELINPLLFETFSKTLAVNNRLRATAACAVLKVSSKEEFRNLMPRKILFRLSQLMNDECPEVTRRFLSDLIKMLKNGSPPQFLPNEFLALFISLDEKSRFFKSAYEEFELIVNRRNQCINYVFQKSENDELRQIECYKNLSDWIPEHAIIFGILILSHDPIFKNFEDLDFDELKMLESRLWKFLQPIVEKSSFDCFHIFNKIGEQLKELGDAESPDFNQKLWTLNEILLTTIKKRIKSRKGRIFNEEIKIPTNYFVKLTPQEFQTNRNFSFLAINKFSKIKQAPRARRESRKEKIVNQVT